MKRFGFWMSSVSFENVKMIDSYTLQFIFVNLVFVSCTVSYETNVEHTC